MGSKKSGGGDFNVPLDPSHPMYRSSDIDLKDVERVRSSLVPMLVTTVARKKMGHKNFSI